MKSLCLALLFCLLHEYYCHEYCLKKTILRSTWKDACKDGYAIYKVDSEFNHYYKDRIWTICCRSISTESCNEWTTSETQATKRFYYNCPAGYFLNGIESKYSRYGYYYVDRTFKFRCCKYKGELSNCLANGRYSSLKRNMNFQVTNNRVLHGLNSWYCGCGDRGYQFVTCRV